MGHFSRMNEWLMEYIVTHNKVNIALWGKAQLTGFCKYFIV